jgi:hypothetical protein
MDAVVAYAEGADLAFLVVVNPVCKGKQLR